MPDQGPRITQGAVLVQQVPPGYIDPHNWTPLSTSGVAVLDWINVTSPPYNADDTGASDSTAAIQAAINANAGPVYFPAGLYLISAPLSLLFGTVLIGDTPTGFGGSTPATWSVLNLAANSNCSMIVVPAGNEYTRIFNLRLNAQGNLQTGPAQSASTGAAIHYADSGPSVEGQQIVSGVTIFQPFNDGIYLGANRRYPRILDTKVINAGNSGTTVYGVGNGINVNCADAIIWACSLQHSTHHGIFVGPPRSHTRVSQCDLANNGQDWLNTTPTTVAAGSNGVLVSTFVGAQNLSVVSTAGFPVPGSLYVNIAGAPAVIAYTGTSGGNTFTNCTTSLLAGVNTGTLATGQNVYVFGGHDAYISTGCTSVTIGPANSNDRAAGCGVYVESGVISSTITGNIFLGDSSVGDGVLPCIQLISPNNRVSVLGNMMGALPSGFPNRASNFISSYGNNPTWLDGGNVWLNGALSTAAYTNAAPGPTDTPNVTMREVTNGKQGISVLVGGTVTVANTSVTASSRILVTSQLDGGTPGFLRVSARSAGVSFTITSSSGTDTSTVAWAIFEPGV
jgi:hypothetical protein